MRRLSLALMIGLVAMMGCSKPNPSSRSGARDTSAMYADLSRKDEPVLITIQHVLIAVKGAQNATSEIVRSKEEAEMLAREVLAKAESGADFASLVREFSDDGGEGATGIYKMVNFGGEGIDNPAVRQMNVYPRAKMAKAFGDIGFQLKVGEFGLTDFSPDSPFGYHIIKRVK